MQSSKKITKGFIEDYISDSTQAELDLKATINNPTFTGNVVVPDADAPNEAVNKSQLDAAVASGVSDGDKGDITVSSGGTTWTLDNDTVGLDELSATGTPDNTTFLRGDNTWSTPPTGGITDGDKGDITVSAGGTVWDIDADTIGLTELSATGTPDSTTFLRGDNVWAVPTVGSGGQTENFAWKFNTATTASDPGSTYFKVNNTTPSLITELYIDSIADISGLNIDNIFSSINGSWNIYFQDTDDATKFVLFSSIADNYINNTGWWTLPVTFLQVGAGGLPSNNQKCSFLLLNKNGTSYTPEDVANKQDNLNIDGTGTKYPTVDAVNSMFETRVEVADTNYTISGSNNQIIAVTSLTADRTITLPLANVENQRISLIDESGTCSAARRIIIGLQGGDTLGGDVSGIINFPNGSGCVESNGSGTWYVLNTTAIQLSAGVSVLPAITDSSPTNFTIGTGVYTLFANENGAGRPKSYQLPPATFVLTNLTTNYICAKYDTTTSTVSIINTTIESEVNETNIIPIYSVYREGSTSHVRGFDTLGLALSNKIQKSYRKTRDYRLEPGGIILTESATRIINISSGVIWLGGNEIPLASVISNVDTCYLVSQTSPGVWNTSTVVTQYNNTQYNPTSGLATLTNNRYAVNYVYRSVGIDNDIAIVLGQGDYTLGEAQSASIPANLPSLITSRMALIGRIIVQKNAATATQIDSVSNILFSEAGLTDHNALQNLQLAQAGVTWGHIDDQAQTVAGVKTFSSPITSTSFIKSGGTSSEHLMADGSVIKEFRLFQSTNYILSASSASLPAFGNGSPDSFTVVAGEVYEFEWTAFYTIGSASAALSVGFIGSVSSLANIIHVANCNKSNTINTPAATWVQSSLGGNNTNSLYTISQANTSVNVAFHITGTLRCDFSGTLTPAVSSAGFSGGVGALSIGAGTFRATKLN